MKTIPTPWGPSQTCDDLGGGITDEKWIQNHFGELISKGWGRKEAERETADNTGLPLDYVSRVVADRG